MEEGGEEDSYGEEEDGEEILGVNDVTSQLAAAGWQHGVHLFIFLYIISIIFLLYFLFIFFAFLWVVPLFFPFSSMPGFLIFTSFTLFIN